MVYVNKYENSLGLIGTTSNIPDYCSHFDHEVCNHPAAAKLVHRRSRRRFGTCCSDSRERCGFFSSNKLHSRAHSRTLRRGCRPSRAETSVFGILCILANCRKSANRKQKVCDVGRATSRNVDGLGMLRYAGRDSIERQIRASKEEQRVRGDKSKNPQRSYPHLRRLLQLRREYRTKVSDQAWRFYAERVNANCSPITRITMCPTFDCACILALSSFVFNSEAEWHYALHIYGNSHQSDWVCKTNTQEKVKRHDSGQRYPAGKGW